MSPIDISREPLRARGRGASPRTIPRLPVVAVCADYTRSRSSLPALPARGGGRRLGFFPGSTIGNFAPEDGGRLPARGCRRVRRGAAAPCWSASTCKKDPGAAARRLQRRAGVTAAFNLNLLDAHQPRARRRFRPRPLRPRRLLQRRPPAASRSTSAAWPTRSSTVAGRALPLRRGRAHPHRGFLQIHHRRVPAPGRPRRVPAPAALDRPRRSFSASICSTPAEW